MSDDGYGCPECGAAVHTDELGQWCEECGWDTRGDYETRDW